MDEPTVPSRADVGAAAHADHVVSWTLRGGVIASTCLLAAGLAISLSSARPRSQGVALLHPLAGVPAGTRLLELGIAVLAATPLLRVAALIVVWASQRDWRFLATAIAVLVIVGSGFVLGVLV